MGILDYLSKIFHPSKWVRQSRCNEMIKTYFNKNCPSRKYELWLKENLEKAKKNRDTYTSRGAVKQLMDTGSESLRSSMIDAHNDVDKWTRRLKEYYKVIGHDN